MTPRRWLLHGKDDQPAGEVQIRDEDCGDARSGAGRRADRL